MRQRHYYSAKKQLLYEANGKEVKGTDESGEADGTAATRAVATKKRGRLRKTVQPMDDGDKENMDPAAGTTTGKKKVKLVGREGRQGSDGGQP